MVPSNCVLNHMLIPWVSEVIYYCNYLEFGIIEAVGWGPAALALEDPENATEHKN